MQNGLVHALRLDGEGGMSRLDPATALTSRPDGGLIWLHFDYTDPDACTWIERHSGLPRPVADALLTLETRPRAVPGQDSLLVWLRGANLSPGAQPDDMIAIRLWMEPGRIISTQRRSLASVQEILDTLEQGQGPRTSGALLADLVDRLTWKIEEVIEDIEGRVAAFEAELEQEGVSVRRRKIVGLRRQAIVLRRYLAPQREALARLTGDTATLLNDSDRLVVREAAERLQRLLEDLDMYRDHAGIAQEEIDSRISQQLNQRLYVLAIITALFLPLGFLTGLFGVNLGGIPGANAEQGFAVLVGVLVLVMVVSGALLLRRRWF